MTEQKQPDKLERARVWSEVIKNCLGAGAVIAAGIWGIYLFREKERPRLQPKVGASVTFNWQKIENRCIAYVTIRISNESDSFTEVRDVKLRGWNFPNSIYLDDGKTYFSPERLRVEDALTMPTCNLEKPCALIGPYGPKTPWQETFSWSFAPDRKRSVYVEARVKVEDSDREFIAADRSTICGALPEEPTAAATENR